jgi:hypothetical protein
MIRIIYIQTGLLLLFILGCKNPNNSESETKERMKLTFQIIPEDGDLYYVEWKDTLGLNDGYHEDVLNWIKRPKETWCIITNEKNDTLGYYLGLSTAQSFAYFSTTDSIINLNFMTGLNFFSDLFENQTSLKDHQKAAQEYLNKHRLPLKYKPLNININTDQRKEFEIELEEK